MICLVPALRHTRMLRATLILALALTTTRADTYFNLSSTCVVREGLCDITIKNEGGEPMTNDDTIEKNSETLQECANYCEVLHILVSSV